MSDYNFYPPGWFFKIIFILAAVGVLAILGLVTYGIICLF